MRLLYLALVFSTSNIQDTTMQMCRNAFQNKDSNGVIKYCMSFAENGSDTAEVYLGVIYLSESDFENAKKWFDKSAALGNADGQNGMGYLYQMGFGVPKNIEKANEYFLKSADQGNSDSQFWLGENLFLEGKQEQGFKYTRQASFGGSPDAQYDLAVMYLNGQGTQADSLQSNIWFVISAINGNEKAKDYIDAVRQQMSKRSFQKIIQLAKDFVTQNPSVLQ